MELQKSKKKKKKIIVCHLGKTHIFGAKCGYCDSIRKYWQKHKKEIEKWPVDYLEDVAV